MVTPESRSSRGRRPNRRGEATRAQVLEAALDLVASGRSDAVSANLVAKSAGLSWGAVQYQFGDADGLWAALLEHILATAGPEVWAQPTATNAVDRVREIVDLMWAALDSRYYRARTNLQDSLARTRADLERDYPLTAAALDTVDSTWAQQFDAFFADLPVDSSRSEQVRALLPMALRGLRSQDTFDPGPATTDALAGLRESVALYLAERPD